MKERLLNFLDNGDYSVSCRWTNKRTWGITMHDREEVYLNVHAVLTHILLHEYLHVEYPRMGEEEVCTRTDRAMQRLSKRAIVEVGERVLTMLEAPRVQWEPVPRRSSFPGDEGVAVF